MARIGEQGRRKINWFRVFARIIGTVAAIFLAFMVFGEIIFFDEPVQFDLASIMVLVVAGTAIAGVIIAWFKEKIGGIIIIIAAISIMILVCLPFTSILTSLLEKFRVMLVAGGPFLIAGILFLLSARKSSLKQ